MKRSRSPRDLWASLLPTAGGVLALAVASRVPALVRGEPMPAWLLVTLLLAGTAAACHRPAVGIATLGLGTMILPAAFRLSGAAPAAALAAGLLLVVELSLRIVNRLATLHPQERRGFLPRSLESTGRAILATLAAGGAWAAGLAWRWSAVPALLAAAAAYLLLWIGLEAADRKIRRPEAPLKLRCDPPPPLARRGGVDRRRRHSPRRRPRRLAARRPDRRLPGGARRRGHPPRDAPEKGAAPRPRSRAAAARQLPDDHPARGDDLDRGPHPRRVRQRHPVLLVPVRGAGAGERVQELVVGPRLREPGGGGPRARPLPPRAARRPPPHPLAAHRAAAPLTAGRHRARPPAPLVRPAPHRPRARSSCSTACCRR